jgi:hypothetical protein
MHYQLKEFHIIMFLGEPDNTAGVERCVGLVMAPPTMIGLIDVICNIEQKFLCEVSIQWSYNLKNPEITKC